MNKVNSKGFRRGLRRLLPVAIGLVAGMTAVCEAADNAPPADRLKADFREPPNDCRPMPFIFVNGEMNPQRSAKLMRQAKHSGFAGVVPIPGPKHKFLSEDYHFPRYAEILASAREQGMKVIFYDTPGFPSGLGIDFFNRYRAFSQRRLDRVVEDFVGPTDCDLTVTNGVVMAAVAMNTQTLARVDLAGFLMDGRLRWQVPAGPWKVMLFVCVEQRTEHLASRLPDYLNPVACDRFIEAVYEAHAKHFPNDFGTTVPWAFFDDVALNYTVGCRTWTPIFNDEYRKKYGSDPALLYPALWMDIGPETETARVRLLGFRAELFAEGWPRRVNEWCRAHKMAAMGHPAGNYKLMPVDLTGDMIQFYRHCEIPLLDLIFGLGERAGFKIISSASANYDRPMTAAEVFGGFNFRDPENFSSAMLYRGSMEVFARGVNFLVPHAIWYEPAAIKIPPLISADNPTLAPDLPAYNAWAARCSYLLQGGRTVADIAVLYPIAAMQAYYHFDNGTKYGRFAPSETDYLKIGHWLTTELRRDFTFLHPETLAGNCSVEGKTLRLNNTNDWQQYRVLILPAGRVVSVAALRTARTFWASGGAVLATGALPKKAAEFGKDAEVVALVQEMFGGDSRGASSAAGGRALFIPQPDSVSLKSALDTLAPLSDVAFEGGQSSARGDGAVMALHKVKEGRHVYFIANATDEPVDGWLLLRRALHLEVWNPHTGDIGPAEQAATDAGGAPRTRVRLKLGANRSMFIVGTTPPLTGTRQR